MTTQPTPPIELLAIDGVRGRWPIEPLPDTVLRALANACPTVGRPDDVRRGRHATGGRSPCTGRSPARCRARAAVACRPTSTAEVAAVCGRLQRRTGVPLTAAGGRSGVTGASVPVFGGVVLDVTGLAGLVAFDATSGVVERAAPARSDPTLEAALAEHGAQHRALPAELRPRDGRGLGRVPRRRPVLHPLRQDRGHRRRARGGARRRHGGAHRRRAARPPSGPT